MPATGMKATTEIPFSSATLETQAAVKAAFLLCF